MVSPCLDEMTFSSIFIRTLTGILQFCKQKHDKHWPLALQFVVWHFLLVVEKRYFNLCASCEYLYIYVLN